MKDLHKVIKTIRLSEKATLLGEQNNEYVFSVDVDATKIDIKQAVEKLLGKKVTGVRTANYFGKARQERRATRGGIGRTDLWGGDGRLILKSIEDKLLTLPDDTLVIAGHGPVTRIGDERRHNPFL